MEKVNREREETKRHKNELEQRITEVRIVQFVFIFVFVYKQTRPGEGIREDSRRGGRGS